MVSRGGRTAAPEFLLPADMPWASLARLDWSRPMAITAAVTLTPANVGSVFVCTGTSADYTVALPTTGVRIGDLLAFVMGSTTTLTKLVTIDAGSGRDIEGSQTRVLWSGEVAILQWTGTTWQKIAGKSIAMNGALYLTGGNQTVNDSTSTKVLAATAAADIGSMCDTTNKKIIIRRAGTYNLTGQVYYNTSIAISRAIMNIFKNGVQLVASEVAAASTGYAVPGLGPFPFDLAAADYIELYCYQISGFSTTVLGTGSVYNIYSVAEVLKW